MKLPANARIFVTVSGICEQIKAMTSDITSGSAFEAYLASKRIDSGAFRNAEPELWESWKNDFNQMHPNSFTVQKLNLINPVRRKYLLATFTEAVKPEAATPPSTQPKAGQD